MFRIDQRSALPIYEQIMQSIEAMIVSGALLKNEQLPSVRSVASDLAVNPNTIQKAYGILEERGIIYSRPGRGSFVAVDATDLQQRHLPKAMAVLDEAVDALLDLQVTTKEIISRVEIRCTQYNKGGDRQ